jgi:hypothetical protein
VLLVAIEPGVGSGSWTAATVLVPTQNPEPPPNKGEEFGKASPVALVVILMLAVATALLIRSMTKRIKRLPQSFDQPNAEPGPDEAAADGAPSEETKKPTGGSAGDAGPNRP